MIASFDIGEKNFAYCIGTEKSIETWCNHNIKKSKNQTIVKSCIYISDILDEEYWLDCNKIIIEQQMRSNIRAQRISQHIWTWFYIKYPHIPIVFVRSSLKTQYFLGKNNLNNKERKDWSIDKALSILTERKDHKNITLLNDAKKKDDLSDTLLQMLAFLKI